MQNLLLPALVLLSCFASAEEKTEEEKHPDDPTKVITRVGLGYTDDLVISGSLAIDEVRKINVRTNLDASEWRLGGSWLFDFGILNFALNRSEYDAGGYKNNYSVGTFLPLSFLGVDTGKWMVFPMAGFSHNTGETIVNDDNSIEDNIVMQLNTSNGGYVGAFALRPITENWSFLTFAGGGMGSDDYTSMWGGGGFSYKFNGHHSLNMFGFISDDDFGRVSKLGLAYTYEFQ